MMNGSLSGQSPPVEPVGPEAIRTAVRILREGGVIAIPTDTVYGLVALFDHDDAINRIFQMKGRPNSMPLPILLGTASEIPLVAREVPDGFWPLVRAFWPGPLTIVVAASPMLSNQVTAGTRTVGVRVPSDNTALELLESLSLPLASTSANQHGLPPSTTASEVATALEGQIDLVLDGGQTGSGKPSTVIDLTVMPPLVRRQGSITAVQLRDALGARVNAAPSEAEVATSGK